MKQNWTLYMYKTDKRFKEGKRIVQARVVRDKTDAEMQAIVAATNVDLSVYTFEYFPTTRTVKNLMTGEMVEIPYDTPRSCDPSSELYWTL